MGEPTPVPLAEVVGPLREAASYEEFRIQRRRGLVNILHALLYLQFVVLGLGNRMDWPVVVALLTALVALTLALIQQRLRAHPEFATPRVFPPDESSANTFLRSWAGKVILGVLLPAFLVWIIVAQPAWLSDDWYSNVMFLMLIGATAGGFFVMGRKIQDSALQGVAGLIGLGAFAVLAIPEASGIRFAVFGALTGLPLLLLGLYRRLAPKRWLSH